MIIGQICPMYEHNYRYNEKQKGDNMMRKTLSILSLLAFIYMIGLLLLAYHIESNKTKMEDVMSQTIDVQIFDDEIQEDVSLGFGEEQEPEIVETMITESANGSLNLMLDLKIRNL